MSQFFDQATISLKLQKHPNRERIGQFEFDVHLKHFHIESYYPQSQFT